MGKWLSQLQKNQDTSASGTDKTDKTPSQEVSSVLSVRPRGVFRNFSGNANAPAEGSVSFVSSPSGHIQNFYSLPYRAGWDEEDWQAAFDERAAILEFDGGLSRADAERLAGQEIAEQRKGWMQ